MADSNTSNTAEDAAATAAAGMKTGADQARQTFDDLFFRVSPSLARAVQGMPEARQQELT